MTSTPSDHVLVPPGWKLVPDEATQEMVEAAVNFKMPERREPKRALHEEMNGHPRERRLMDSCDRCGNIIKAKRLKSTKRYWCTDCYQKHMSVEEIALRGGVHVGEIDHEACAKWQAIYDRRVTPRGSA